MPPGHAPAHRTALALWRGTALALLAVSSYWALRLAWADHLSYSPDVAAREHALALAPLLAPFAERLAQRREELGADSLPALERAQALDPENPDRLMRLGQRAELAGDTVLAEQSLRAAAARSRLYQPKYLLAQYYFRRGNEELFWKWARAALETSPGNLAPVFELCWRMRPNAEWLNRNIIPARREVWREYLTYLTDREHWAPAAAAARSLAETAVGADVESLVRYCETSLAQGQAREPWEVWNTLCRRGLLPGPPPDPDHNQFLTNGGFEHAPAGQGFDWHLGGQAGVSVAAEPGQLRVTFSGHQPEQCPLAWQFVSLQPGTRYRLRYEVRAPGKDAASGIAAEILGATPQAGSTGSLVFVASQELGRVYLIYRRPAGSVRLEGTVAIANVRLERAQ